jgi:hypothetical protein
MTAYVILLLVLAGLVLVAAAFFDRWRGRQIEGDVAEEPGGPGEPRTQGGRHRAG